MTRHDALYDGLASLIGPGASQRLRNGIGMLKGRSLVASVGLLVGGTGLAAVITAVALPVLTRLYSPLDFSVLAALTGLISIASVSACLRFDIAVPIPEHDAEAANVLALAVCSAAIVTLALCLTVLFAAKPALALVGQSRILPFVWLIPAGVFAMALYSALQAWLIRRKSFALIARNRVMQSCIASGSQIVIGLMGATGVGLLLGPTLGIAAACIALACQIARLDDAIAAAVSRAGMGAAFLTYHQFPKYSALEALANTASIQIPVLMIAALAPASEAGYLLLAIFVVQAPMGLLGTAIGQVFLSHAPHEHRLGQLGSFTASVFRGLLKTGVGPLIFGGLLAPVLFGKIFGDNWQRAGELLAWMTPWFILQYLASPLSMALHIVNRQGTALALQLYGLALRVAMVYAAYRLGFGALSEFYAVSGAIFYGCYLAAVLKMAGIDARSAVSSVRASLRVISLWVIAGAVCLALLYGFSMLKSGIA